MDDRLQKFAAIVEAGSYTDAAKHLHISQPALSVAIAKLEKSLKTKLFQSTGRGVELTKVGEQVYESALAHRAIDHNLQLTLASIGEEKIPLRIGMIDSVAALISSQEEPLKTLEHWTELGLFVANSAELRAALLSDKIDIAVVVADKTEDAKLQTAAIGVEQLLLVCHASSALHFQALLDSHEKLPYISYVQTSTTNRIVTAALAHDSISTTTMLYSTSQEVMLQMALRGRGVTLLPEHIVAPKIANGELEVLRVDRRPYRIERRLSVVALKGRKMPPGLSGVAQAVQQQLKNFTVV